VILLIAAQDQKVEIVQENKRNRGIAETGSSSATVEVLQHIHENRDKYQEKEGEQMKEVLSSKDEKHCLQKKPPTKEAS
jgi:hypothetical protein